MLLEVNEVVAGYGRSVVLQSVSLGIEEGEVVAICGRNGAGKSTLLRAISGVIRVVSGGVYLDGLSLTGRGAAQIARLGISHVPEGRCLFSGLTVKENLLLGLSSESHLGKRERTSRLGRVCGMFPWIGDRMGYSAGQLSGGQQQMVAIGRGLMGTPRLLILDEPSLGLAPLIAAEVFAALADLRGQGMAILLVEENLSQASVLGPRSYTMNAGILSAEAAGPVGHVPQGDA